MRSAILLILAIFTLAACGSSEPDNRPADQKAFSAVVLQYAKAYKDAPNEIIQNEQRALRKTALASTMQEPAASGWIGKIDDIGTSGSSATLTIKCTGFSAKTWNNSFSEGEAGTFIPQNSPLFATVRSLKKGDLVQFSGQLFPDDQDHFREVSMTESGGMTEPEFLFRFTEVKSF
ncbi:hypothetical protein [Desulfocurvibacter africanus]|uniref:Lipoprotein n=1 Tax=Desulfocurvibacter africanus subsp. africanus str. Walvis Bay TaxID=690850 RepID=F3Z2U9_DESAF|nr:hypothetical protein [Desulfocurvibacter africanus]EGJ50266.1 hypothetical protein Desaf_1937 [Desulfocurvibacter africanus subsp. africanus str. Walvis Bay]